MEKLDEYYLDEDIARLLGIELSTLAKNCSLLKNVPPFIKIGKRRLWPKSEVHAWLKKKPVYREKAS